jgi:hypothetical protein
VLWLQTDSCSVIVNSSSSSSAGLLQLLLLLSLSVSTFVTPLHITIPSTGPLLQHFCQIRKQYFGVATLMGEVVLLLIIAFCVFCCCGCSPVLSLFLHPVFPCLCAFDK